MNLSLNPSSAPRTGLDSNNNSSTSRNPGTSTHSVTDDGVAYRDGQQANALGQSVQQRAQQNPRQFRQALEQAYAGKADPAALDQLAAQTAKGQLPQPSKVRFVDAGELGHGALGAYDSADGGTIFLDRRLQSDPKALESVYTEELGHHLDAKLGGPDAASEAQDGDTESRGIACSVDGRSRGTITDRH